MDPVDLYRCGGRYYVLDGRHRIAVARALGERWVLANITDVRLNHPRRSESAATGLHAGVYVSLDHAGAPM